MRRDSKMCLDSTFIGQRMQDQHSHVNTQHPTLSIKTARTPSKKSGFSILAHAMRYSIWKHAAQSCRAPSRICRWVTFKLSGDNVSSFAWILVAQSLLWSYNICVWAIKYDLLDCWYHTHTYYICVCVSVIHISLYTILLYMITITTLIIVVRTTSRCNMPSTVSFAALAPKMNSTVSKNSSFVSSTSSSIIVKWSSTILSRCRSVNSVGPKSNLSVFLTVSWSSLDAM